MTKYKYYLKKPKGEIAKDVLFWIGISGIVVSAASGSNATGHLIKLFVKVFPHKKGSAESAFRRLLKNGCITFYRRGPQIYISLTEKGKRKAGRLQINHLQIKKPKRWDGKWRLIMFDIAHDNRLVREALRGFLKRLNFIQMQKSVWLCPYNCKDEIALLCDFFKLSESELRVVVSSDIGDERQFRKLFGLK